MGILYIVATPLGNLEDITLRALRILGEVSLIATEDTRTTGRLLKHFDIDRPLLSYYEHNKITRLERIMAALERGDVALVSEAGTPLLSDPGHELVRAVLGRGFAVRSIPGPSALTAALPVSGLPLDRFLFLGFLPRKGGTRRRLLQEVQRETATLVFFESPHRVRATLADMVEVLGGERPIALCREMTKLHEEIWRGSLAAACREWAERERCRGEFTLVVAGAEPPPAWDRGKVKEALIEMMASGIRSGEAVRRVRDLSGWPKGEVYTLAEQIKEDRNDDY